MSTSEAKFWELIELLDAEPTDDGFETMTQRLAAESPDAIVAFADHLAQALYALDTQALGDYISTDPGDPTGPKDYLSGDGFLYVRCAIVAAGKEAYKRVLADPTSCEVGIDDWEESLLYVAPHAWEQATGTAWEHEEPVSYESFSNTAGWPDVEPMVDPALVIMRDGLPIGEWWLVEVWDSGAEESLTDSDDDWDEQLADLGIPPDGFIGMPLHFIDGASPDASTRVTEVIRQHGELPNGASWQIGILMTREWGSGVHDGMLTYHLRASDVWAWTPEQATTAVTALASLGTIVLLRQNAAPDHPAMPQLHELVEQGRSLLAPEVLESL